MEIKSIHSPDIDVDEEFDPPLEEVYYLFQLEIGLAGDQRCDVFQAMVATPEGLKTCAEEPVLSRRATVVISAYSRSTVLATFKSIVEACAAETWNESVLKLQRYFIWEYEDFVAEKR